MTPQEMLDRLDRLEEQLSAKGHPLQDASTIKMVLLDLMEVLREVIRSRKS